jgi:type III secretory pathway component EscT
MEGEAALLCFTLHLLSLMRKQYRKLSRFERFLQQLRNVLQLTAVQALTAIAFCVMAEMWFLHLTGAMP